MLKLFSSRKHGKKGKKDNFEDTDTCEQSNSRNQQDLSASVHSATGVHNSPNNNNNTANATATTSNANSRSGSVPYAAAPVHREDSAYDGNERNSNYSCVSGDSDDYVPRKQSGPTQSGSPLRLQQQQSAPISADALDVVLPATRYVYDTTRHQWGYQYVRIRVLHPNRGIAQDDLHVYFACDLLLLRSSPVHMPCGDGGGAAPGDGASHPTPAGAAVPTVSATDAEILAHAHRRRLGENNGGAKSASSSSPFPTTAREDGVLKVIPVVARMFRHDVSDVTDADYLGAGQAQAVAESLAYKFNRFPCAPGVRRVPLPLLTNRNVCRIDVLSLPPELRSRSKGFFSYVTTDSRDIFMMVEPDVRECGAVGISFSTRISSGPTNTSVASATSSDGDRTRSVGKHPHAQVVGQDEDVYPPFDSTRYNKDDLKQVAEAFSHFSYQEYHGRLMVHGLLLTHHYLVDPLVYTMDKKGFGMGNDGPKAIDRWRSRHRCNDMCRAYQLDPVNDLPPLPSASSSVPKVGPGGNAERGRMPVSLLLYSSDKEEKEKKKERKKKDGKKPRKL